MFLSPHEVDKLTLYNVGLLAQRRLARGVKLNHPEAIGLIATVTLELIRDGKHSVVELMELGRTLLGKKQVISGVADPSQYNAIWSKSCAWCPPIGR